MSEQADQLFEQICRMVPSLHGVDTLEMYRVIAAALTKAAEDARERCAEVADMAATDTRFNRDYQQAGEVVARTIRTLDLTDKEQQDD